MRDGIVFDVQRFCWQDGPGIRTVVFLKGCPLNCAWCHNPESKSPLPELFYDAQRCVRCRRCALACPQGCHRFEEDAHIFLRERCTHCFSCAAECPTQALAICGKPMTVDAVLQAVLKDRSFYEQSGGGVTLSGGEPLLQYAFSLELLQRFKAEHISTAVETCGYTDRPLEALNAYCDHWLFDVKLLDEEEHIRHTGRSNRSILRNLLRLDELGAHIILRCPIIPGVNLNERHFRELAALSARLQNQCEIQLEPYHPLGIEKSIRLGKKPPDHRETFLSEAELSPFLKILKQGTSAPITIL